MASSSCSPPSPSSYSQIKLLKTPTSEFLVDNNIGNSLVQFTEFKLRDLIKNTVIYHVKRPQEKFIEYKTQNELMEYNFPRTLLNIPEIGATVTFCTGNTPVQSFCMIERHYFRDKLLKTFEFNFGFLMPMTVNTIEHVYSVPEISPELKQAMVQNPKETRSDSFYFADGKLVMHNKAVYTYE